MLKESKIKMKAWLITWEGTSKKITEENRIIAIISYRRSGSFIEDLVDTLYQMCSDTAYEMAFMANRKKGRYLSNHVVNEANICFGKNSFIYARKVRDLEIFKNKSELTETVAWCEPAEYIRDPENNYEFKEEEPLKLKKLTRSLCNPLLNIIH
ncbi:MAG: hypothetical protein ABIJ59_15465 [Pseudomonadota bacterium]